MTTTAILMRELETMPEGAAVEVLDFAMFLKKKHTSTQPNHKKMLDRLSKIITRKVNLAVNNAMEKVFKDFMK